MRSDIEFEARRDSATVHGFTLVELLVVITIIGILAALTTVAVVAAQKKARETAIKSEINQIDAAFEQYKNASTAYPPNCQMDGIPPTERPIDERTVYNDLQRHMKQVFSLHQEDTDLIAALVEIHSAFDSRDYPQVLMGGMTAGEALVFWLGGFSSDRKYPISGEGGPSYRIPAFNDPNTTENSIRLKVAGLHSPSM